MRVVCDNCGATYRIPDHKLVREVNKATCRKCGHGIIIRKAGTSGGGPTLAPVAPVSPEDATQIASAAEIEARARSGGGRSGPTPSGFGPAVGSDSFVPVGPAWAAEDKGAETVVSRQGTDDAVPGDGEATAPWVGSPPGLDAGVPTADPDPGLPSFGPGALPLVPGPAVQSEPPRLPSPPSPPSKPGRPQVQRARLHDPSADMAVVLGGAFAALLAVIFLVTSSDPGVVAMALFAAFAGLLTAIFLLATSSRGREEGKPVVSIALALVISAGVTFLFHSQSTTSPSVASTNPVTVPVAVPGAAAVAAATTQPPEVLVQDGEAAEGETAEGEAAAEGDAVADAEPVAEPEPKAEPKAEPKPEPKAEPKPEPEPAPARAETSSSKKSSSSSRSSGSGSSGSSSKKSSSDSSSKRSSSKKSSSKKSSSKKSSSDSSKSSTPTAKGVPLTVLDTMVKNNRRVKSCFAVYKEKTGSLPSGRIPVKIAIEPDGVPYKVWINGGAYSGTTLDKCLGSAIKTIVFPPFAGEAQTYNYLFVF